MRQGEPSPSIIGRSRLAVGAEAAGVEPDGAGAAACGGVEGDGGGLGAGAALRAAGGAGGRATAAASSGTTRSAALLAGAALAGVLDFTGRDGLGREWDALAGALAF